MNRLFRIALLGGLVFASAGVLAQSAVVSEIDTLALQRAGLERRALFLDAWLSASNGARDRARRVLRLERDGAARIAAMPSVRGLTRAWHALSDEESNPFEPNLLRDLAESLDLRVIPGFYEGKPEGLPEALTVRVAPLYPAQIDEPVQVTLTWLGANGKEIQARSEPVAPQAFTRSGFVMYVRAPSPVPGTWRLVCEVGRDGKSERGVPISVIGLDQPDALLSATDKQLQEQFVLLREHGVRPTFFRAFLERMGALDAQSGDDWVGARQDHVEHEIFRSLEEEGHHTWSVGTNSIASPKCILVLLKPEEELPEAALVGAVGHAWKEAARANSWWVLAPDLPLRSDQGASLLSLAGQLEEWKPDSKLILVGRGSALLELQLAQLHRPKWVFDRMVLSTVLSSNASLRNLPKLPGLIVASESDSPGKELLNPSEPHDWVSKKMTDPLVVTDLALPGAIAIWLAQE